MKPIKHARFNNASNPVGNPWRHGFCDAVMGRESNCPWKNPHQFYSQLQYLKGYLQGKATGVTLHNPKEKE